MMQKQKENKSQQGQQKGVQSPRKHSQLRASMYQKQDISVKEAQQFIKNNFKDIKPQEWRMRNKYFQKVGLDVFSQERQKNLQKQQTVANDNINIVIFEPRTNEQIRNRYLSKLNLDTTQERKKKHQHFFIFDWDDTILCTSYLSSMQFLEINNDVKNSLKKLDETSSVLLKKVEPKGEVFIITNAAKGWVEYSSKLYLPKTHEIVRNSKIKIVSARSMFGGEYPGDFGRWKIEAFKYILQKVDKYMVTNLICIGDSNIEMEAVHCVGKQFSHGLVKTIKFRQNPKTDELIKQQELVISKLSEIFQSTKNLTIRLERKSTK